MSSRHKRKKCCVAGCSSALCNEVEVLFKYPPPDSERYKRWLELFPQSFMLDANKNNYICRRHFTPESFDSNDRLKNNANPTVNIDTSYAQDRFLRDFLIKVIYEWALRVRVTSHNELMEKATEASNLLGMPVFSANSFWLRKFLRTKDLFVSKCIRFTTNNPTSLELVDIIKDMRQHLPSNFKLPVDLITTKKPSEQVKLENKCETITVIDDDDDPPESDEKPNLGTELVGVPFEAPEALDTYEEALDLLKPLDAYISRIGNENALARLREIENVVQQVIEEEKNPKKTLKRRRT